MYRWMYIWLFSRSEGAGSATTRNTRGLTRAMIALMVPPLPAASRPSKITMARRPLCFTHSCSSQSSAWSFRRCFSYSLRFIAGVPFDSSCLPMRRSLSLRSMVGMPGPVTSGNYGGCH